MAPCDCPGERAAVHRDAQVRPQLADEREADPDAGRPDDPADPVVRPPGDEERAGEAPGRDDQRVEGDGPCVLLGRRADEHEDAIPTGHADGEQPDDVAAERGAARRPGAIAHAIRSRRRSGAARARRLPAAPPRRPRPRPRSAAGRGPPRRGSACAKAATTRSASRCARLKRRSIGAWTRRRIGWNSAATRRVDAGDGERVSRRWRRRPAAWSRRFVPTNTAGEERGHDRVGERPPDDPVDVVQAVAQDRDADRDGQQRGREEPERPEPARARGAGREQDDRQQRRPPQPTGSGRGRPARRAGSGGRARRWPSDELRRRTRAGRVLSMARAVPRSSTATPSGFSVGGEPRRR